MLSANSIIGVAPFSFAWSSSETTASITPTSTGMYHVTVTDASNCNTTASFYVSAISMSIEGSIDPYGVAKRVYLISHADNDGTLTAIDSIDIEPFQYFTFSNLDVGKYLVKATLLPLFTPANFFPSYYDYYDYNNNYGTLFWNNAHPVQVYLGHPIGDAYFSLVEGNNPGGPGFIGGLISEGANLTHNDHSSEGEGDPIANQIVHLLKQDGTPVSYAFTDESGAFSFSNIAYGNYKLVLDIINKTQGFKHISINPNQPSTNIHFIVNDEQIVLGNKQPLISKYSFSIFPNPTSNVIDIKLTTLQKVEALIYLTNMDGKILISKKQILLNDSKVSMSISHLPKGIYYVNVSVGNQMLTQKITKL